MTYMPRPRTIQIFLPDGHARSVRIAEITSRTLQAVQMPRTQFDTAAKREEIQQVGVYFLFARHADNAKPQVYIGEAENCLDRIRQQHQKKDFWQHAVAITSKTHSYTKAHAKFLEWHCMEETHKVRRFAIENGNTPSRPFIPEPVEADLLDDFDTIRVLLSTLGYPLFEAPLDNRERNQRKTYRCEMRGARAHGTLVDDGFVVREDSRAARSLTPSARDTSVDRIRQALLNDDVLRDDGEHYVFTEDYVFDSPSGAAVAVLGRHANGWTSWKDEQGRTLDANERQ